MLASITLAVGLVVAIPVPEGPEPVELFAAEAWYKDQAGKEQDFTGLVVEFGRAGRVGFGRNNPYRLLVEGDKPDLREVYVGGKPDALRAFVGKRVKLTGKAVEMEVEGNLHREVWPARLVVLDAEMPPAKVTERLVEAVRKQLAAVEQRRKEVEAGFNVPIQDDQQAVRMKLEFNRLHQLTRDLQAKLTELEQPAGVGVARAELEGLKQQLQQQRASVEAAQQQLVEVRTKLAAIAQQNPAPEVLKKIEAVTAESQARLEAERAKLAELEARYQRALRLPPRPDTIPPQGNAGGEERLRGLVRELEAVQAEVVALAQKAQAVNDPNAGKELLEKIAGLQKQREAIAQEILKLRGGK